ncbi:DNA-3-methyladenine glycosylase 2 family protein [Paenibacillus antri]|uniref:DNA-3-methyladenine glycosylase II n=1 Tax=Paenibacillus antri TaxID=2582848 RepID=A0A5R9GEM5_9BACL|nr:DNA-3-methyladenine glycosylase [Paenibacillus antri]TLS53589.1 DNA-3-methyladenine glycosylase 2 family protein [Paenibacillus antri]
MTDVLTASETPVRIPIPIVPPYDAKLLFERYEQVGNRARLVRLEPERMRFARAIRAGGGALAVAVEFGGDAEAPTADAVLPAGTPPAAAAEAARAVAHMIGANVDLAACYAALGGDARFASLFERLRGSKLLLDPDPFECMMKTIITQQLNLSFAGTLIERLAVLAGETLEHEGKPLLVFPDAEAVARLSYDELRALSFSQRKAEYVIDTARAVVDGRIDWSRVERMSDDEAMRDLTQLRGIGRWSVECLLIFAYGRADLLPAADIGLRNAVRNVYGLDAQPSAADIDAIGAAWAPWRTYATYYLWESLRLK